MTALGYQASSLKPYLTTPDGVLNTFRKLHDIGYRHVQLQWIDKSVPLEATRDALQQTGLTCIGTQDAMDAVLADTGYYVRMNQLWGSPTTCVSSFPRDRMTREGIRAFLDDLAALEQRLSGEGIQLTFHPLWHNYACAEGIDLLDAVAQAAQGRIGLTLCVHHIARAGLSPVAVLQRYQGRVDICHFKDSALFPDGREHLVPVGQGRIDWPPVFDACHETGVRWGLVEQESWQKDAFDCAREAYEYISAQGIKTPLG